VLYKQKLAHALLDALQTMPPTQETRANTTSIMVHILHHYPKQILDSQVDHWTSSLLFALSIDDPTTLTKTLTLWTYIVQHHWNHIQNHPEPLIKMLLSRIAYPSITIRLATLELLTALPKHNVTHVRPQTKRTIIKQLDAALDDKKRLVRKQATLCKSAWL
jgi:DNA repair/transcription protein MET18/MMS19